MSDERPPAEGADPAESDVHEVLPASGEPSQAEGADPAHPDDEDVLDADPGAQ